ncbi:MAG: PQQ-binding-like beta-propeller repeat protein, partial [Chloroflexi bacterium]|nr:PQQ-binding-like beta-propeller repeat protein [Chloroflexota bacterium]
MRRSLPKRRVIAAGVAGIVVLLAAVGVALYFILKVDLDHASAPFIQDGVVYYGDEDGRVYAVDIET